MRSVRPPLVVMLLAWLLVVTAVGVVTYLVVGSAGRGVGQASAAATVAPLPPAGPDPTASPGPTTPASAVPRPTRSATPAPTVSRTIVRPSASVSANPCCTARTSPSTRSPTSPWSSNRGSTVVRDASSAASASRCSSVGKYR